MTPWSVLAAWLAADFVTGVAHWWEDRYGVETWPIVGPLVVRPNIEHHALPTKFLKQGIFSRNWTAAAPSLFLAMVAWWLGSPWLTLVFAFSATANEIHAWSHQRCSRPIRGLQLLGVLHSQEQHAAHHRRPYDKNYCVMTDWLNPVLTAFGFWLAVESVIAFFGPVPSAERAEA